MPLLLALVTLFLSLLSPFLGYIFIVSAGGNKLFSNKKDAYTIYLTLLAGVIILWNISMITVMEMADITVGIVAILAVFIGSLRKKKDYVYAFLTAGWLQICYGITRSLLFGSIFRERVNTFITGYAAFFEDRLANLGETARQAPGILENAASIMIDYQVAIWSITMLMAMYIGIIFLPKKIGINCDHHLIRFPYWLAYILIASLLMAVIPASRTLGYNGLLVIMVFFLIQGLSIIDYYSRNHFKKNRFVMIATATLIVLNFIFGFMIAALGLLDYWLNVRKINNG